MQKDLNVIFPEEIAVGDDIFISLVLEKSKRDENIDFSYLAEDSLGDPGSIGSYAHLPVLKLVNFLSKDTLESSLPNGNPGTIISFKSINPKDSTGSTEIDSDTNAVEIVWQLSSPSILPRIVAGIYETTATFSIPNKDGQIVKRDEIAGPIRFKVASGFTTPVNAEPVKVTMTEAKRIDSPDQLLWILIRNRTVDFNKYKSYMESVMCDNVGYGGTTKKPTALQKNAFANRLPFHNAASYSLLKYATEYYLMQECGLVPNGLYETDTDINWDLFNSFLTTERNIEEEFGRTARSVIDVSELRNKYLEGLNGEGGYALPYFNLIRQKLQEVPLKEPHELPDIILYAQNDGVFFPTVIQAPEGFRIPEACYGIQKSKLLGPCMIELLWSYWHEEAGLVQTMNAISRRFQNVRSNGVRDPMANFNLDPLRPLNNLMWGYIEDERNRLSITRRNLEYQYEYGVSLIGSAVSPVAVAEHRTYFIRAFHNLLKATLDFYNQANFTTVIPDGFPLLNHLREVHLLLAEGAHNQYGDLAWTSRVEMLSQQWLLSRPEMREFIGGRIMVPYTEAWMDKVDIMKQLQNWDVPNVTHFHDLAVFGEQLLLSIRFGSWNSTTSVGAQNAANWAHYWRNEVQRYAHAYNAVTGVDLGADVTDARVQLSNSEDRYIQPAFLIQKQAAVQKSRQQNALQGNGLRPALPQNVQFPSIQPVIQKKLNG